MTDNEKQLIRIIRSAPDPEALMIEAFRLIAEQLRALPAEPKSPADRLQIAS